MYKELRKEIWRNLEQYGAVGNACQFDLTYTGFPCSILIDIMLLHTSHFQPGCPCTMGCFQVSSGMPWQNDKKIGQKLYTSRWTKPVF